MPSTPLRSQPGAALQLSISVSDKQQNPAQASRIPSLWQLGPETVSRVKGHKATSHQKPGIPPVEPTAPGWQFRSPNTKP